MTNEKALQILVSAARSLAELKIDGEMIQFGNDWDFAEGEEIREALAHLTKRAVDECAVCHETSGLKSYLLCEHHASIL